TTYFEYQVRVWKVHEDVRTAVDTLSFTEEAIVYHLQQNQVYVLRVLGFSSSGDGAISEARYFMITSNTLQFYSVSVDPAVSQMCFYEQYSGVCDGTEALSDRAKSVIIVGAIFLTVLSTNILSELKKALANSVDPDETPHDAASHQGLRCLLKGISRGLSYIDPTSVQRYDWIQHSCINT
ncbi:hypothetical protein DPMN_125843, partial [Dreissena polymorpha]